MVKFRDITMDESILKKIISSLYALAAIFLISLFAFQCRNDTLKTAKELLEGGDFLAARALYERLVEKSPRDFATHYGLGMTWCAEAMYKTEIGLADPDDWYPAIYQMTIAPHIDPLPAARNPLAILHFNLGTCYKKMGNSADAVLRMQQAVAYDSTFFKAWNLLGALYHEQGNLSMAENCYRRAIILKPDYAMSHFNLGALSWARKEYAMAEKHFQDAVTLEPQSDYFEDWLAKAHAAASAAGDR
jgi:tetratricopeptide (TPR) repeat protein